MTRLKTRAGDAMSPPACTTPATAPAGYPEPDRASDVDVFLDVLQGVPPVRNVGKRTPVARLDPDDDNADAREIIDVQRDELQRVLADSMIRRAIVGQGIQCELPRAPGANSMLVLVTSEGWLNTVSDQCFAITGCRLVKGIGRSPKEVDAAVSLALSGGRSCAIVVASLDEVPGWVAETADALSTLRHRMAATSSTLWSTWALGV